MFAILPLVGGVLAGWKLDRRAAIATQFVLWAVAVAVLTLTAPQHGDSYSAGLVIGPALAVVSAGTLALGFVAARRSTRTV
jgi:hypothetical protein